VEPGGISQKTEVGSEDYHPQNKKAFKEKESQFTKRNILVKDF
jgi:hypothetical protein